VALALLHQAFAVVAVHDPEESSLLRRNEDRLHTGSPHPLEQVQEFLTGTNRRGTELHEPPDLNLVVLGEVLPSNASDDDRVVVRNRADRVRAGFQFSPHLTARLWSAGRRSRPKDLSSDEQERTGSLGRQASLDPSGLPAAEVVRPLEPELLARMKAEDSTPARLVERFEETYNSQLMWQPSIADRIVQRADAARLEAIERGAIADGETLSE
jgi:hypothetical protein